MIYLDYNATAPELPSVHAAMEALGNAPLNAASTHAPGRLAKKHIEDSRATIAAAVGAFANEVLFTGSGTEANNMVLRAFTADRPLLVGSTEHPSILSTARLLGGDSIAVDASGVIDLANLDAKLTALGRPALVSVQLANNVTGVIQPVADIAALVHRHGGLFHCDAVQALGKIPFDWGLLGADMVTICAHKSGGPVGVGVLLIRSDLPIRPLLTGGKQELGRRAGTENVRAIVGFATLIGEVIHCPHAAEWERWRNELAGRFLAAGDGVVLCGLNAPRLPNTLQVAMPGVKSETQLMHFDLSGFCLSAGSACSSGTHTPNPMLLAMGIPVEVAETAVRVSFGWDTKKTDLDTFAECWLKTYERLSLKKTAA